MKKRTPKETEAYFEGFEAAGETIPIIGQRLIARQEHKLKTVGITQRLSGGVTHRTIGTFLMINECQLCWEIKEIVEGSIYRASPLYSTQAGE